MFACYGCVSVGVRDSFRIRVRVRVSKLLGSGYV